MKLLLVLEGKDALYMVRIRVGIKEGRMDGMTNRTLGFRSFFFLRWSLKYIIAIIF